MHHFRRLYWLWRIIEVNQKAGYEMTQDEAWEMATNLSRVSIKRGRMLADIGKEEIAEYGL